MGALSAAVFERRTVAHIAADSGMAEAHEPPQDRSSDFTSLGLLRPFIHSLLQKHFKALPQAGALTRR